MRLGVFSDIHGNVEALTAVVAALKQEKFDRLFCLGDVVGYGASPNECCEVVRGLGAHTILGNHDAAVTKRMDYTFYYGAARQALDWCAKRLSPENRRWLEGLEYTYRMGEILFCHGSPRDPPEFEYIFAPEQARELLPMLHQLATVMFIGHSHLTKTFALAAGEVNEVVAPRFGLRKNSCYLITAGSVGQPRDYDRRACYGILDVEACLYEFRRVEYDIRGAASKIVEAGLSASFAKRLFLGV